jgi:preprotein translocase subunit YajC
MDPTFVLLIVALAAFIIFQIFQGRKRRRETEERQLKFVPGVEIMTNYGVYGTILTLDDETNVATIETTPGTVLKMHRQTILKVADYAKPVDETVDEESSSTAITEPELNVDHAIPLEDPQFGERSDPTTKPPRGQAKKVDE